MTTQPERESEAAEAQPHAERPQLMPEVLPPLAAETAEHRISSWYEELPPELGVYLTDPNVVLTLADARGTTEFYVGDSPENADEIIAALSVRTEEQEGVRFSSHTRTNQLSGRTRSVIVVESLAGYQRTTGSTKLPGIPRFDAADGFGALDEWYADAVLGVKAASESGHYPKPLSYESAMHLVTGVMRGYPDAAVMSSVFEVAPEGDARPELVHTQIPESTHYPNAQPNFLYHPKDEAIVKPTVDTWGAILADYYASAAHEQLESRDDFQANRFERAALTPTEETERQSDPGAASETARFVELLQESRRYNEQLEAATQEAISMAHEAKRTDLIPAILQSKFDKLTQLDTAKADPDSPIFKLKSLGEKMAAIFDKYQLVQDELDIIRDRNRR